jgi:hypothetical protein
MGELGLEFTFFFLPNGSKEVKLGFGFVAFLPELGLLSPSRSPLDYPYLLLRFWLSSI